MGVQRAPQSVCPYESLFVLHAPLAAPIPRWQFTCRPASHCVTSAAGRQRRRALRRRPEWRLQTDHSPGATSVPSTLLLTRTALPAPWDRSSEALRDADWAWLERHQPSVTERVSYDEVPPLDVALQQVSDCVQRPLGLADRRAEVAAEEEGRRLMRDNWQDANAIKVTFPLTEAVGKLSRVDDVQRLSQRWIYPMRGQGAFTRAVHAVHPPCRYYELHLRTEPRELPLSREPRRAGVGNADSTAAISGAGMLERVRIPNGQERVVVPGGNQFRVGGSYQRWHATAKRWGLLGDDVDTAELRQNVLELPMSEAERGPPSTNGATATAPLPTGSRYLPYLSSHARLIVIGDVHGCREELQVLLRVCDYRLGDVLVFLGDLVTKGPDSQGVVQMARELGAYTVRGNHDYEVLRWREALNNGERAPSTPPEHCRIAQQLSNEDYQWLRLSPWYIVCEDLETLFVHAGFVPGVPLGAQNPRMMMNIRSVTEDGVPTVRYVAGQPWARYWRGPWRVVWGHDAFTGLQEYEYGLGIDTGCVYGGRLTALLLPENRLVSVPARRAYVQPRGRSMG